VSDNVVGGGPVRFPMGDVPSERLGGFGDVVLPPVLGQAARCAQQEQFHRCRASHRRSSHAPRLARTAWTSIATVTASPVDITSRVVVDTMIRSAAADPPIVDWPNVRTARTTASRRTSAGVPGVGAGAG